MSSWDQRMNTLVDRLNDFMAVRSGLLPLAGVGLIVLNLLLHIYPGSSWWIVDSDLFLHIGLIAAILGLMIGRALH